MDFLMATSRGRGIPNKMGEGFHLESIIKPGAKLTDIKTLIEKRLARDVCDSGENHVYILAGIPDITELLKNHRTHYRECIYSENPQNTIQALKDNIQDITNITEQLGAKAIFCTIAPINIKTYNQSFHTSTHTYAHLYDSMQTQINQVIIEINSFIQTHNRTRELATPLCHFAIVRRHGKGHRGYYKYHWEGLFDGVHATGDTQEKWANSIKAAIHKNRSIPQSRKRQAPDTDQNIHTITQTLTFSSDEDQHPPKRHWKSDRTDFSTSYNQ